MAIIVFDTETTGFNPQECGVVEYAHVELDPQTRQVVGSTSFLTHPGTQYLPIPAVARAVHHISDADIAGKPHISQALNFPWTDVEVFAAHNMAFDWSFVGQYLPEDIPRICTHRCALHLFPDAPSRSNQALRYWLDLEPQWPEDRSGDTWLPHRALFDAYITAALLARMLQLRTLGELISLTSAPVLLHTCSFGKHKDVPWSKVPKDYCAWMLRQGPDAWDQDVIYTIRYWLGLEG